MKLPTERSLALLRACGYLATVVEYFLRVPGMKFGRRRDAFGFGDILAVGAGQAGALLVQTTSRANLSSRLNKMLDVTVLDEKTGVMVPNRIRANVEMWLRAENKIEVHGWVKKAATNRWEVRRLLIAIANDQPGVYDEDGNPVELKRKRGTP